MDTMTLTDGWPNHALTRYMARVCYRYSRGFVNFEPDDLLHDAILILKRKSRNYDPNRSSVSTLAVYACRSARSRLVQRLRRPGHHPVRTVRLADPDRPLDPPDHRTPDPAAEAERRDVARAVRAQVAGLPDRQQQLVTRRFGLGGADPANLAELADGEANHRVRNRVGRALDRLRTLIAPPPTDHVPLRDLLSRMDQLRAVLDYGRGRSVEDIADRLGVTAAIVRRVLAKHGAVSDTPAVVTD